jgi:IS30 family transposase
VVGEECPSTCWAVLTGSCSSLNAVATDLRNALHPAFGSPKVYPVKAFKLAPSAWAVQRERQFPKTRAGSGLEMAQHQSFTVATNVKVYFCDPQSPWQRGTNENTNGLLRQYLPKTADLSCHSQADLDQIALRLNQRPRKTLGFETPASRLQASVASTP